MARRYLVALLIAWATFAAAFATGVLPIELGRRGSLGRALAALLPIALGLGLFNALVLATTSGPAILWLGGRLRDGFTAWHAALVGASSLPLFILLTWYAVREHGETFVGLLRFCWRVPGELLLGAIPAALAGAVFGAYLGARGR